ncbi:hypothetical protein JCM15765_08740 [Paradesulfitobacterium aromaticivorans]
MTRFERIKAMSIAEVAEQIISRDITDKYCKSDCSVADNFVCEGNKELQCCIRWLKEDELNAPQTP